MSCSQRPLYGQQWLLSKRQSVKWIRPLNRAAWSLVSSIIVAPVSMKCDYAIIIVYYARRQPYTSHNTSSANTQHNTYKVTNIKKLSYRWQPARRVYRSVKVTKHITILHMLDIVSYCAIVTVSLRCGVFTIFHLKNVVTLKSGSEVTQGHWKWLNSIDCDWFPISVLCSLVTLSLKHAVLRYSTCKCTVTLKTG